MQPDEIRMMDNNQGILISGNQLPIRLTCPPFFTLPDWNRETELTPAESLVVQRKEVLL